MKKARPGDPPESNLPKSAQMLVMDVSKTESIAQAVETLTEKDIQLDVLINNAGIIEDKDRSILNKDFSVFENTMNTNAHGALKVAVSFLLLMKKPSKIINISSSGGSMSEPVGGWSPAYCVSKSMLNAITRHLSFELKSRSIAVNAVCPGWVQTDMGGDSAIRPVEKGAETPVWLASEASQKITGKFFRDKKEIDW